MHPAIRKQSDAGDGNDDYSLKSGLDTLVDPRTGEPTPDLTRQEYKDDADVNLLLNRFGVNTPTRAPLFGELDFDLDMQQAFEAAEQAKEAWRKLPDSMKEKYPTWQAMLTGAHTGALAADLKAAEKEAIEQAKTKRAEQELEAMRRRRDLERQAEAEEVKQDFLKTPDRQKPEKSSGRREPKE